jgi:hypothetical protein
MAYDIATIGELGSARPCCAPCGASLFGCGGQGCARASSAAIGDVMPEALALTSAGFLPTVVWPSDVDALKRTLGPDFRATDAAVQACAALPAGVATAWGDEFRAWRAFEAESTPIFGAANKYDEARAFEARLSDWQAKIGTTCPLHSPRVTPPTAPDLSALKWLAVAVGVVGAAYLLSPLVLAGRKLAR